MALVTLDKITLAFGGPNLLDEIDLNIERHQRTGLLGRNGAGKSTLMKIISGHQAPDSGAVHREKDMKISYFSQDIPENRDGTVFEIVAAGLGETGEWLLKFFNEETRLAADPGRDPDQMNRCQEALDRLNGWLDLEKISRILTRMSLNRKDAYNTLSGGMKRRVLLAAALVSGPDLLLLDEPTNHLDIDTITWLETFLLNSRIGLLFVTHDRMLLRRLSTRIIELDRGKIFDWAGDYDTFLKKKEALQEIEELGREKFDRKMAQEEIWLRRGIKARRTRNEGRVRALLKMREERQQRRYQMGRVNMELGTGKLSGKIVFEVNGLAFGYDGTPVIRDFSTLVARSDKIGLMGPNGCGKTTLVNLLLGRLKPDSGSVKTGTKLTTAYYDQMREQLDDEKSVRDNVLPSGDFVEINGRKKHIISYLQEFLFSPDQARAPVAHLSGGERNRLLLARLFTRPANLLVLDEPTNDLDVETLELLEEQLVAFPGTVLLISHDRAFLNNVVTGTLAFTSDGAIEEHAGGYDDWLALQPDQEPETKKGPDRKQQYKEAKKARPKTKLTYKEKQDLEELPGRIETLETEQNALYVRMADPAFFTDPGKITGAKQRLTEIENELEDAFTRWEYLDSI